MPSPYETGPMLRTLRELNRLAGKPITATRLAEHLGISDRTARYYLSRLEQAGYVRRPAGVRSGWAAA
jgi:DNA-binding IclR family transcriptional regulator